MNVMELFFYRVENIVGKGENAGYQHFLLFPQCFQCFCVAFVADNATMSSIPYFENHVRCCAKPKEVEPMNLNFYMTNKRFDSTNGMLK